ncbi:MAG: HAD-IC family P-type ATPase [Candidatus Liptonbacteria bacterium]|nr:HAD-IC family P-type ATPase [Candidatus Liptonbacteria bacterium]
MNNQWHTKSIAEVLTALSSSERGLTKEEAGRRFKKYGLNKLPEGKIDSFPVIFLRQFQSPLIYILLVAAVIVFAMGKIVDGFVILIVLVFNAIVGTIQEGRARNIFLALKKFSETSATVMRDGKEILVRDVEVVPGDIIVLQEGEKVPADARIIFTNILKVDEASLTGESEPISKTNVILTTEQLLVTDQKNMVFKGTHIVSGNCLAVVVATGLATEIGKIAQKITAIDTEIPLKANIRYLSRLIILTILIINSFLVILGVFFGKSIEEMFMIAVALSVSMVPEGLPIVVTLVLATGMWRMSKRHVLVKRLQAVETLGQAKIIAVDKTGTLTRNEMIIQRVYVDANVFEITGSGYEPKGKAILNGNTIDLLNYPGLLFSAKVAGLCANARLLFVKETNTWKITGDPTEAAMLVFSEKIGFKHNILEQEMPKIFELPFDYQKKYRATIRVVDGKNFLIVAGAPEKVIELCKKVWSKDGNELLNEEKRKELESAFFNLAREGFRIVAYAINSNVDRSVNHNEMPLLTFVGFFGMKDALRPEVKKAVERVKSAGMRMVMITGDHRLTAEAIAKEAGIYHEGETVLTGEEIDKMLDEELAEKLSQTTVFSRVTPDHKLRIIQAYRKRGEVVAMTGDGVNDAPSLVAADLGVAMGKIGTEVAKEASDLVLLDDNFASIVSAVEEGRNIYKTIKKVILFLFTTSISQVLSITGGLILGFPLIFLPSQIIWLNFVTAALLDIAIAMEPKEKGLLRGNFERPKKWIIDGLMVQRIFLMAVPMAIGTLYLFQRYFEIGSDKVWVISLTTLAVFQWFNAWNCRSEDQSIFRMNPLSNKFLIGATAIVVFLQVAALYTPFLQQVLRTQPITLLEWLMIILVAFSIVIIEEIRKLLYRRFKR